jgi:glucan-binding YG repeat protein
MQTIKTTAKRRKLALFVAIVMALSLWTAVPLTASAEELTVSVTPYGNEFIDDNGMIYAVSEPSNSESNASVISYKGNASTVTIPDSVTVGEVAYVVDSINIGAFAACPLLEGVTIGNNVTLILHYAFWGCTSLSEVIIPESVTNIFEKAFYNCQSLEMDEDDLAEDIITESDVFGSDDSGISFGMSGNYRYTVIDGKATLWNYTGNEAEPYIPAVVGDGIPVKKIGAGTFCMCKSVTSVNIPEGIESIGFSAFNQTGPLSSVTLPTSLKRTDSHAFLGSGLTAITLPDNLEIIGPYNFAGTMLTEIKIPESVTSIGERAFSGTLLTEVTIPPGVNYLGSGAFADAPLDKITVSSQGALDNVSSANYYVKTIIIENGPTEIPEYFLYGNTTVRTIVIPESITSLGDYAFLSCSGLTDVTVPSVVLTTGMSTVFANSKDTITTVTIADGVTEIPEGAFDGLTYLEKIILPGSITSISAGVFADIDELTEITIPDGVEIGEGVLPTELGDLKIWCYNDSDAQAAAGTNAVVMIESIKLDKTALSLNLNGKQTLTAEIATPAPESVTIGTPEDMPVEITWSSSNEAAVTVDEDTGEVTAVSYGSAGITASVTTHSGVKTATCNVTVVVPPAPTQYVVTVENGTGSASYAENATVNITANAPASGKVFDKWTSADVTFANATSSATSFVMPAKAVTVTATYKDEPVNPPVNPPVKDNGWVYANGVWKYFKDGKAATGWAHDGKAWYYLNSDGEMQTGWIYDQNKWYYLAGNGAMKTGWVQTDGSWYYLSGNGAMVASRWLHDTDGSWYYLSGNGKMLTGKQSIGGKAYTFKSNGVWIG